MERKRTKTPVIILAIGLVLALVACLFVNVVVEPTVTEQNFPFSVTYKLGGETKTLEGEYVCRYNGYGRGQDPRDRYYTGEYIVDGETSSSQCHTIAEKDGAELYIVALFNDCYLMGDTKDMDYEPALDAPFLEALTAEGYPYDEMSMPSEFAAEIVSWEYPEPVENTFAFKGFSILHAGSMIAMLVVGLLVIVACLIFAKRDKTLAYNALDVISIVLDFAVVLLAIPFITLATALMQIVVSGDEFVYQILLCVPALTAFTVAASIALRRNGYRKSAFFILFVGPVLFFVPMILEELFF